MSSARLESLQTLAAQLASPLPLQRIAAVVGEAAMELLDAEIVAVAVHVDDSPALPQRSHRRRSTGMATIGCLQRPATRRAWSRRSMSCSAVAGASHAGRVARGTADPAGRVPSRPDGGRAARAPSLLRGRAHVRERPRRSLRARARPPSACPPSVRARVAASTPPETAGTHLRVGDMDIDLVDHNVSIDGRVASLTASEMRLLTLPGRAARVTRGAGARSCGTSGTRSTSATSAPVTCTSPTCGARSSGPPGPSA